MTNYEKIQPGKKNDKSNPVTLLADKNRISLIPGGLTGLKSLLYKIIFFILSMEHWIIIGNRRHKTADCIEKNFLSDWVLLYFKTFNRQQLYIYSVLSSNLILYNTESNRVYNIYTDGSSAVNRIIRNQKCKYLANTFLARTRDLYMAGQRPICYFSHLFISQKFSGNKTKIYRVLARKGVKKLNARIFHFQGWKMKMFFSLPEVV